MPHLRVSVLGELEVLVDEVPVSSFESDKVRALLAYLAVEADRANRRETLVGLLWPECPEGDARHNLSQALFNLRLALGDHTAKPPYLFITRDAIQFNRDSDYSLDLDQFNGYFVAWGKNRSRESIDASTLLTQLKAMAELYRGEFLQQFFLGDSAEFEAWVLVQRETLHQRAMEAITILVNEYEQQGDYETARRYATRQLELDPWREEVHYQVMHLLALAGQRSAALAQYENCRKVLAEELGVEPSSQTRDLYEQIRSGTLKSKAEPAAPVPSAPIHNLPVPLTAFVGREQELADLAGLIADPECRHITLVGPGGIGKTRLALQAAEQYSREFAQGTTFIPLASAGSVEVAVPAIATGIGFAFYGPTDPKVQLFNYLRDKQMLLVVDNVEHLLAGGPGQETIADLLIELLQAASRVKLLVTSREVLNLQGEWILEVQGLAFPAAEGTDRLDEYSAAALFIQRARRARPGFEMSAEDKTGVVRLCRLVEGMPLAIELAAAWVRILSPAEIAREIETSLDFLNAQMRDLPERHRSMRAVFDHSWQMLSTEEQQVLCKLSVFRGGFQRQAAEEVASASLPVLSSLVTRSLLRRGASGRYDLHELIRQYAESKARTARDSFEEVAGRHSAYYMEVVRSLELPLIGPEQVSAREEFVENIANIRPAWDYAVRHDRVETIKLSIPSFWNFYETNTWFHEAVATFGLAADEIERACGGSDQMDAAHVILYEYLRCCQGWFCLHIGKSQEARSMLEEGVKTLRSRSALAELSRTLHYLGVIYWLAGEYTQALELFHEKLELDLPGGITWNLGIAHGNLGMVTETLGLLEESRDHFQQTITIYRKLGDLRLIGVSLFYLGSVENKLGMVQESKTHLYESLELSRSIGNRWGIAMACNFLGLVFQKENNHVEAQRLFQESLDISREMGEQWSMLQSLINIGFSKCALGDPAEAQACFLQALRQAVETQLIPCILDSLAGMALIYAGQGKGEDTLELVMHIQNHPAMTQETKARVDQLDNEIKNQFSESQREEIYIRARAKPFERVVEDILATSG